MSQVVTNLASPAPIGYHEVDRPMDAIRTLLRGVPLVALVAVLASCSGKDPYNPGTKLGTFHVNAKLRSSTCGKTPDPWEFDVRLNHDRSVLYWIQGGAPIQGNMDASATSELHAQTVYDVRAADEKRKLAVCSVSRDDELNVTLNGADAKPVGDFSQTAGFSGGISYTFAPVSGSDCTDQLTDSGGGFDALPCRIEYVLVGTLSEPPQ
jgi:hypothetical protein